MNAPLACDVSAPPSARDVRTDLPHLLALVHNGPGVTHNGMAPTWAGARVSRARPSPRSEPPHSVPRWGRAAGDVGPYHSLPPKKNFLSLSFCALHNSATLPPWVWGYGISLRNCSDVKSRVPYTLGHTGGPRLSRPGPVPGPLGRPAPRAARVLRAPDRYVPSWRNCSDVKSRVPCTSATREGRACRGRALRRACLDVPRRGAARVLRAPPRRVSPRRNCSDVKSRVSYTLDHTGGPRLSRPGPAPGPAWTSRAEGGAGTSRADAPRIDPAELFRREIARPLHPRPHGRAALVAAGLGAALDQHPTHGPATRPPTHGLAREVPAPPSARGVRTGLPRWLALTHEDLDIGRGARPARPPAPHAHARLGCWTPRRRGRAAGDVGPYHSPTRTYSAPMLAPRRPGARSTRAAPGAWRPNASGPVRWPRREGRNSVHPSTQARRRPGRHGGPGSGQPPLRAHGAQGVRFRCVIKSYS